MEKGRFLSNSLKVGYVKHTYSSKKSPVQHRALFLSWFLMSLSCFMACGDKNWKGGNGNKKDTVFFLKSTA